jgi:hypothetical protein
VLRIERLEPERRCAVMDRGISVIHLAL